MYKNLGDAYYFNGNYTKAIVNYGKAIKLDPNYDEAYYNMSACCFMDKNYQNAKIFILKAMEQSPSNSAYSELKSHIDEILIQAKISV